MREPALLRLGQLGERDLRAARDEDRVVAEAARAARRLEDPPRAFAPRGRDGALRRRERDHAHEAGVARRAGRGGERGQQRAQPAPVVESGPAEARRAGAGRAAEPGHLEPRVVGQRETAGGARDRERLGRRVRRVVVALFRKHEAGSALEPAQLDREIAQEPAQLAQLAGVRGRHDQLARGRALTAPRRPRSPPPADA